MINVELNTEYLLYTCVILIFILFYCLFRKNKNVDVKEKYENEDIHETQYLISNNEILKKKKSI